MPKIERITPASGVTLEPVPTTQDAGPSPVPFRKASQRKIEKGARDVLTIGLNPQIITGVIEGTGYLESVDIEVTAVSANAGANVAWAADAPWNALQNVTFKAVGPDLFTLTGYQLYLLNLYAGNGLVPGAGQAPFTTADPMVYQAVAGAGGTAGSCRFNLRLPMSLNARSLLGLLGNQDAGSKYQLTTVLGTSAAVWTTPPNGAALPQFTINKYYNYTAVPAPVDNRDRPQQQIPPAYGVLHMANALLSEGQILSGTTVNHYLRQLGNTNRLLILVARLANGSRSDLPWFTVATHTSADITFKIGDDILYQETAAHRRKLMWDRYRFDAPAGVLVYDWISDFANLAGFELGDDYLNTQNIPNAQLQITYPAFAGGPGSLEIISDMLAIPEGLDVLAAM